MKVAGFMTPAEKTVTASPFDTIGKVMDLMVEHHVGAVVVLQEENVHGLFARPLGIITKSDILAAHQNTHIGIDYPCHKIMSTDPLVTVTPNMSRDRAAFVMEQHKIHHVIVVDDHDHNRFAGLLSTYDITTECAKDHRAWPWNRTEDGKFHNPHDSVTPMSIPDVTTAS